MQFTLSQKTEMKRHILVLVLALAYQADSQVLVDNQDPRAPRPSAAFASPLDYYGITRPSMDPSGVSYRPSSAGAVLMEPSGTARPTGFPLAFEPAGYASGYGGFYSSPYDFYFPRPPVYVSNVGGSHIFPETAGAFLGRVPVSAMPGPGVVVPFMPVSTVSAVPAGYPATSPSSVNYPVPSSATVTYPASFNPSPNSASVFPGVASNLPAGGSIFPSTSSLAFGNGGLGNTPGVSGLQNLPNLQNLPVGSGNLQLGSGGLPLNSGNGVFGASSSSVIPNGNFLSKA